MLKAVLAGPLRHAAGEIHFAAADFPPLVSKFDNYSHGTRADDSPFALGHIGNLDYLAIHQSRYGADPDRIADPVNIASQWRLPMVDVLRRAKHFQVKAGPALAVKIDRVALVKIDSPRVGF